MCACVSAVVCVRLLMCVCVSAVVCVCLRLCVRQIDVNPEVTAPVLDLIALYFRAAHVMACVPDLPVLVGLWAQAGLALSHALPPTFVRVSDAVRWVHTPTEAVQRALEPFGGHMWAAFESLHALRLECERVLDGEVDHPWNFVHRCECVCSNASVCLCVLRVCVRW